MPWDVQFRAGVYLPQLDWWLDAHFPQKRSFVSHAHSDHTAPHREILCSAGTARLMRARMPLVHGAPKPIEHILPFGQTEQFTPDSTITLHPAGHIFGSAQACVDHAEYGRLLYTGDFKLRRGLSAEPCATPATDVLIMETTFGRPHYVFPPTEKILGEIAHFCHETLADGGTPVLFGYSLGKSQELLSGLAAAQLPVMLHPQTFRLTKIYEDFGIVFPPHREFSLAELAGHVVIAPPQSRESSFVRKIRAARTAITTGWAIDPGAIYRYQCDAAFPLSDHADFPDLLRFVELVQPKRVLTLHGFAADFARTLRERGLEAWALSEDNQLDLELAGTALRAVRERGDERASTPSANYDGRFGEPSLPSTTAPEASFCKADPSPSAPPFPQLSTLISQPVSSFARFAAVADAVKSTPRKLEKIEHLRTYLAALAPDDAAVAATFLTGRPFPQTDPRNLNLGWSIIKRAVLEVAGINESDYRAAYHRFADTGDATAAVLTGKIPHAAAGTSVPLSTPNPLPGEATGIPSTPRSDDRQNATLSTSATLADLAALFDQVAAARGPAPKLDLFRGRLRTLSPDEARYLVKIITGDLRIGLKEGLLEEAIAAAASQPIDAVREANMLSGDIAAVIRAAFRNELDQIQLTVFHPLQFMLASPEPTAEAIVARFTEKVAQASPPASDGGGRLQPVAADASNGTATVGEALCPDSSPLAAAAESVHKAPPTVSIWLEEKYDGIRCQLHKLGSRVELYSRDLNRITGQFPDLARAAQNLPGDFIIDGELLAWRDGRALPFAELQKRLGRTGGDDFFLGAEIPVSISAYDLLWRDGRTLLKEPLSTRRALLEDLFTRHSSFGIRHFTIAPVTTAHTADEIESAFRKSRARGNEGLMAKDPASPYTPGRRGLAWLKLKKAYATLDVVVVGVEYGHGKRRDVLSDYTFAIRDETHDNRLLTVGKAYSGLTDAEIATLTEHFLATTLEVRGRFRVVVPDTVIEVAFDIIQPSSRHQSGFALRFPRIARLRPDKTPADIDTLETCRKLAAPLEPFRIS
ncbi:MAG TPA: ATP-dependent DNA ligase [Opitutus sp.]|nr:ATP-dependent DNA ligase [Opitutus sp.]